jgi:uncharacterized membrane protein HdeD (DUF308 family)
MEIPCTWSSKSSLILRGIIAILFGILAVAFTGPVYLFLVYFFGIFVMITAIITTGIGLGSERPELPKWLLVIDGIIGLLIGIFALLTPVFVGIALALLIAAWALITGVSEFYLALVHAEMQRRLLLGLSGVIGIAFAFLLIFTPLLGGLVLVMVLGIYAIIFGIASLALGFLMKEPGIGKAPEKTS